MKTNKPSRVLVVFLALVLAFSTGVIVLADDAYGMQGAKRKLQMIQPADLHVDSASDTEYVNTLNVPVELTEWKYLAGRSPVRMTKLLLCRIK